MPFDSAPGEYTAKTPGFPGVGFTCCQRNQGTAELLTPEVEREFSCFAAALSDVDLAAVFAVWAEFADSMRP